MLGEQTSIAPDKDTSLIPSRFVNKNDDEENNDTDERRSQRALVKRWQKRITDAKEKWRNDFKRMKDNMDFVAGLQWDGQTSLDDDRYIVNMTLRAINQRTATLYAKNPKVEAIRRQRLDFQIWDGKLESIQEAVLQAAQIQMMGGMVPPQLMALFNDFQAGRQRQQMIDKVGETLKMAYHYQQDSQEPSFKTQMKQLVRRACSCGVGYIKVRFEREFERGLTQSETRLSFGDRVAAAKRILEKVEKGKIQETDADMEVLRSLIAGLQMNPLDTEAAAVSERLVFDFPQSTAVIPDPACRMLRGFVGGHWIVEEFRYPLEFVNAFFEKNIKAGQGDIKEYGPDGKALETASISNQDDEPGKRKVVLWLVYDLDTKTTFYIMDGYKDYVQSPDVVTPAVRGFWTIFPVTFNDIEVVDDCKATIFPPSDVDLIRHAQKEHNRCRQSLRRHRKANRPRYLYPEGQLKQEDLDAISAADDQELIGLKGLPPGTEPGKTLQPLLTTPIAPELYDTAPLQEDALLATGQQEANVGPAQPNVTATVGTIAEQSRISVAASDVDGLDDSLTDVAQCGGEMMLREMSIETIKRIVGEGAVWPEQNKEDFLNQIELRVVAASSGRPNKAVDTANWERVVPLILQAASLPPQAQPTMQAIIRQTIKTIDANLDPVDFFPLPVPMMPPQGAPEQGGGAPPKQSTPRKGRSPKAMAGQPEVSAAVPLGGA